MMKNIFLILALTLFSNILSAQDTTSFTLSKCDFKKTEELVNNLANKSVNAAVKGSSENAKIYSSVSFSNATEITTDINASFFFKFPSIDITPEKKLINIPAGTFVGPIKADDVFSGSNGCEETVDVKVSFSGESPIFGKIKVPDSFNSFKMVIPGELKTVK